MEWARAICADGSIATGVIEEGALIPAPLSDRISPPDRPRIWPM